MAFFESLIALSSCCEMIFSKKPVSIFRVMIILQVIVLL